MQSVFVRFVTEEDRVRGFAMMAKRSQISSLPGQIYQVPIEGIPLLESERINYRRATDDEVRLPMIRFEILLPLFYNDARPKQVPDALTPFGPPKRLSKRLDLGPHDPPPRPTSKDAHRPPQGRSRKIVLTVLTFFRQLRRAT
jgi:hypothetical protein